MSCIGNNAAHAESATFLSPSTLTSTQLSALSTANDGAGVTVDRSASLQLLFDRPFATVRGDRLSIFTLPAGTTRGSVAQGVIRFGVYDNGAVTYVAQRFFRSGRTVNVNNLFQRGCGGLGGCNFIEIITRRTRGDAQGVRVDYVQLNGEVVSVAAPTPEPAVWTLMILGFACLAWRARSVRRQSKALLSRTKLAPTLAPTLATKMANRKSLISAPLCRYA